MDSAKAAAGKEAWEQMERDGVIERVKAGTNTDWSSALHLAPKAGGGAESEGQGPGAKCRGPGQRPGAKAKAGATAAGKTVQVPRCNMLAS